MKVKVFVHAKLNDVYENGANRKKMIYQAWPCHYEVWGTLVCETEIDVPDQISEADVIRNTVKVMRKQQQVIRADAEVKFQNIEQQIQEMLCLPAEVKA